MMNVFLRDARGNFWATSDPDVVRAVVEALISHIGRTKDDLDDLELLRLLAETEMENDDDQEKQDE